MAKWMRIAVPLAGVALVTLALFPVQLLAQYFGWGIRHPIARLWHGTVLWAVGVRVRRVGAQGSGRPLLIAANHVSWTDVMAIGSVADVTFIAKAEVKQWPLIGPIARLQRTVFVERDRKRSSGAQAGAVAERLGGGEAVVLFAEGTTSDGTFLLPFKSTLVGAAAIAAGGGHDTVFVQPVAIAYTRLHGMAMGRRERSITGWIGDEELVPHLMGLLGRRAFDAEVRFGEPIAFRKGMDRKQVTREAEAAVRTMLAEALGHSTKNPAERR
ncbi:MAG: 1-acyl-sn-glycerol-3-phosphate acyltransferase [Rhizobiaceae bacterium]|nr:1-acyl-sn-glycerol-3-phosphate acyltransferase [Rhizobiaceae bacterium]